MKCNQDLSKCNQVLSLLCLADCRDMSYCVTSDALTSLALSYDSEPRDGKDVLTVCCEISTCGSYGVQLS